MENLAELGFATKSLHTPFIRKDPHGAIQMPVYDNVAFEFNSSEDIELAFQGKKLSHMYSRISNPTVEYYEQKVKSLTNAFGVIALSSGMAAISNLIITIMKSGDNIITTRHLFANTYSLFETTLRPFGINFKFTDLTQPEKIESLIDSNTKAIYVETITNPHLEVADLSVLSSIAKKKNILLIADTTLTPPCFFNSKKSGVDVEVISSTKFFSGGATSVGGLIIDNGTYDWGKTDKLSNEAKQFGPFAFIYKLRREVFRNFGSCMSPHTAYLQNLGLETLELRVEKSCSNCLYITHSFQNMQEIKNINYPGLSVSPFYDTVLRQFNGKAGAILTFDLNSKEHCFTFMDKLKIIRRATNINDNRTLIIHPASTIFCEYGAEEKNELGIRETMLRLSVGIEDKEDLINDIYSALK